MTRPRFRLVMVRCRARSASPNRVGLRPRLDSDDAKSSVFGAPAGGARLRRDCGISWVRGYSVAPRECGARRLESACGQDSIRVMTCPLSSGLRRAEPASAATAGFAEGAATLSLRADVAELVDAHGSGPCGGNPVEVQVLSSA
jgi:hypothetical protein